MMTQDIRGERERERGREGFVDDAALTVCLIKLCKAKKKNN